MNRIELLERNCLINRDKFINDANIKHDNLYDYTQVQYKNAQTKVTIICAVHGTFNQSPNAHLNCTIACKSCAYEQRKLTVQKNKVGPFIEKLEMVKNPKYDYSQVVYVRSKTKVAIQCDIHGVFYQTPNDHLTGYGCVHCRNDNIPGRLCKTALLRDPVLSVEPRSVYKFQIQHNGDIYYKVGVSNDPDNRMKYLCPKGTDITLIEQYHTTTIDAIQIEDEFHTMITELCGIHGYPFYMNGGRTECYQIADDINLIEFIKQRNI